MKQILKHISVLMLVHILVSDAIAQNTINVSGMVTAFNTIPLKNVKVKTSKSGKEVLTDDFGKFSIECFKKDVLTLKASGFKTKTIRLKKENVLITGLEYLYNASSFEEAVMGGHISHEVLQNAIENASKEKIRDYSKYNTIYELIASEIYNVRVRGNSIVNTKIRSFDASPQVLYVVDNKIVSDISFVIPEDVKEVEFIDDVRNTLYGMQGANGVIKITLK